MSELLVLLDDRAFKAATVFETPTTQPIIGLVRALAKRLDIVERRVGIRVQFQFDESLDIPRPGQRDLYFVAIEALNNVLKHAGADEVSVIVAQENDHIQMTLTDNGRGFDLPAVADKGGLGLQNMRQRIHRLGGTFEINTAVGAGVRLTVTVPYE